MTTEKKPLRECEECGRVLPRTNWRTICATCRKPEHLRRPMLPRPKKAVRA